MPSYLMVTGMLSSTNHLLGLTGNIKYSVIALQCNGIILTPWDLTKLYCNNSGLKLVAHLSIY